MMVVFLIIIMLIAFGIEEIFHEQSETNRRIKDNLNKIWRQDRR